jgi:plasmid maintenance system antidote protein VapI
MSEISTEGSVSGRELLVPKAKLKKVIDDYPSATFEELAAMLGVSTGQLRYFAREYGFFYEIKTRSEGAGRTRRILREDLENAVKNHPDWTQRELADLLGTEASYIAVLLKKYGISYVPKNQRGRKALITKEALEDAIKNHPNVTQEQLADILSVNRVTIRKYLREYGLTVERKVRVTKEKLEKTIKANPNVTKTELASLLGISRAYLRKLIKKYKIAHNPKILRGTRSRVTKEMLENAIKENPNATQEGLGDLLGIHKYTVGKLIKKYGISYTKHSGSQPQFNYEEALKSYIVTHPSATLDELAKNALAGKTREFARILLKKYGLNEWRKELKAQFDADRKGELVEELFAHVKQHPETSSEELLRLYPASIINFARKDARWKEFKGKSLVEKIDALIKEHPEYTQVQIAKELRTLQNNVSSHITRHGIAYERKNEPAVDAKVLRQIHNAHPDWTQIKIADVLGVHVHNVSYAARQNGIKFLSYNERRSIETDKKILDLHEQHPDWTGRQIASALGINNNTVYARVRDGKLKLPARSQRIPAETLKNIHIEHPDWSAKKIESELGYTRKGVLHVAKSIRIELPKSSRGPQKITRATNNTDK